MYMTADRKSARTLQRSAGTGGTPRICVMGCGAITESLHLPALSRHPDILREAVLVDPDLPRARALAARFGMDTVLPEVDGLLEEVDGVIVAAPPELHFHLALQAIRAGCDVLCEKPLATSEGDAVAMVSEASAAGVTLCVNNTRRLYPAASLVHRMLQEHAIGQVRSIRWVEGFPFEWPTASGFYFQAGGHPQGVLSDIGSHVVDLLCWWMGERATVVSYRDDSLGGPEAVARLELAFGSARAEVWLSRLSLLENRFAIEGTAGDLEGEITDRERVRVRGGGGRPRVLVSRGAPAGEAVIENFLDVVRGRGSAAVPGETVVDSISVIHTAYARRQPLSMPWMEVACHEA